MIEFTVRVALTILMCLIITYLVTGVGAVAGRSLGLDDGHNMGEVVAGFLAGGIIMLIYSRRFDDDKRRDGHGR